MAGSIFVHVQDASRLIALAQDLELLDELDHVEMDYLLTLDFEGVCGGRVSWCEDTPVVFDEGSRVAVVGVTAEGLEAVLAADSLAEDHERDIRALRAFVSKHGAHHIYEISAF